MLADVLQHERLAGRRDLAGDPRAEQNPRRAHHRFGEPHRAADRERPFLRVEDQDRAALDTEQIGRALEERRQRFVEIQRARQAVGDQVDEAQGRGVRQPAAHPGAHGSAPAARRCRGSRIVGAGPAPRCGLRSFFDGRSIDNCPPARARLARRRARAFRASAELQVADGSAARTRRARRPRRRSGSGPASGPSARATRGRADRGDARRRRRPPRAAAAVSAIVLSGRPSVGRPLATQKPAPSMATRAAVEAV